MIKNDDQLAIVRGQLATAESALDSLREEVLPQNRKMYDVMAESYIDMILSVRGEIDTYLGIAVIPEAADLVISLEGDRVGLGHTSAGSVTRFIDSFRRGLQSAVEILESVNRPVTSRRRERWIENICDLPFVGIVPGSVKILLGEPEFQSLFSEDEKQSFIKALDMIFDGLNWADVTNTKLKNHPFEKLTKENRQSLLALISRLLPPRRGNIERVAFQRRSVAEDSREFVSAILTRKSRDRIRHELQGLSSEKEFAEKEGVIRSVDLDAQSFVLRERPNEDQDLPCEYGAELEDVVKEYLDCCVLVSGSLETSKKTKRSMLSADAMELLAKDNEQTPESET